MNNMVQVRRPSGSHRYQAPEMRLGRSQFDLTHQHKTTYDAGDLVPVLVQEVVPGDTFTCKLLSLHRIFSPLDAPIMDNIEVGIDFFFVPNRLTWTNWEAFLGAHDAAGAQDTDFTIPIVNTNYTVTEGDLFNYMGLPVGLFTTSEDINALPFRCYISIYNEWYRDQNLIDEVTLDTSNGPQAHGVLTVRKSAKKHDYFTSALPYLQKGDPVSVAFTSDAIITTDVSSGAVVAVESTVLNQASGITTSGATGTLNSSAQSDSARLYADLQNFTGLTINALRESAAIQRLLERDARGGTRHPELIRAHFGVDVPDYRTQRPEYLGGGQGYINVSAVANTAPVDATASPDSADWYQGQLSGIGVGTLTASWAKSFVEHGYILGILRARADVSYQQGVDRMWSRSTKYDFLWPELAQLGEQEILNKELWIEGDATDDNVFGYQERYAEYRFKKSLITGKFASDATGSLDYWHLAEDFGSQPSLNQTFIEDASPMSRVVSIASQPDFIMDARFDLRVARALPVRPVPTLMPARF